MIFIPDNPEQDRHALTADELDILENKVLPTARRWLGIHSLAKHGAKTLAYWGEEIEIPDTADGTTRREIMDALGMDWKLNCADYP